MGREARANAARRKMIEETADAVAGHFIDRGKIIEIGFFAMIHASYPGWQNMPKQQIRELRMAFFGGAQHLFGSIMGALDSGHEPTEQDLRRMSLISHELESFIEEFKQHHGITDPDIGSPKQTTN